MVAALFGTTQKTFVALARAFITGGASMPLQRTANLATRELHSQIADDKRLRSKEIAIVVVRASPRE